MARVRIPTPLRGETGGADEVTVDGSTVGEVLHNLRTAHPGLENRILSEEGTVQRFVNVFVGDEDSRHLQGLETPVEAETVLSIIPAMAGGTGTPDPKARLARIRESVSETNAEEVHGRQGAGEEFVLVDVREREEFEQGYVPGAAHIPRGFLELRIGRLAATSETPIVVYCGGGTRSLFAAADLQDLGYTDVLSMAGGFRGWKEAGLDFDRPRVLSGEDRKRYERHLSIPEVGEAGQFRLLDAKVLCVGAGGLGSPSAYYLAAAGVGTIGIIDDDLVDESNLQRQILHNTKRVGTPKVESAKETLEALNPGVRVVPHRERLTSANVDKIFSQYDLVVDGADNFPTRYLVNDGCVKYGIPNVHGSVFRFEGQATVFWPGKGPCYRCLYPEPPPPEMAPSCAEAGVLGILPGVVGLLEAVEAIKILLGIGDVLVGRLLCYDALAATITELKIRRDPECAYCGEGQTFPGFVDYAHFCAVGA